MTEGLLLELPLSLVDCSHVSSAEHVFGETVYNFWDGGSQAEDGCHIPRQETIGNLLVTDGSLPLVSKGAPNDHAAIVPGSWNFSIGE